MRKVWIMGASLGCSVALATVAPCSSSAMAQDGPTTVASGLNGPMGVLVAPDGSLWLIETGIGGDQDVTVPSLETGEATTATYGISARVIRVGTDGTQEVVARLPSLNAGPLESQGGGRLALVNGALYATSGGWGQMYVDFDLERWPLMDAIVRIDGEQVTEVADVWALERSENPDGGHLESNPYALTAGPGGTLWMTDAAGNYLMKADPTSGQMDVVAVFDMLPSPIPNPARDNALVSDPVPTGVAFDREGNVYVSLLPGFPFLPGSGKVVRVSSDGAVTDYATGLTMPTDLRLGPDGHLYAVSFGQFTEQGPVPNSGALIRIAEGSGSETVLSGLAFPTSVDFNQAGDAYLTIFAMAEPGAGLLVKYGGVAAPGGY